MAKRGHGRFCFKHDSKRPCVYCIRSAIRTEGHAGVMCVLCDKVGHPAKFCPQTSIGRMRQGMGDARGRARRPEAAE